MEDVAMDATTGTMEDATTILADAATPSTPSNDTTTGSTATLADSTLPMKAILAPTAKPDTCQILQGR
jgi:hypothetical protein